MFKIWEVIATNDNDKVKTGGKDYVNVKPVWRLCACVATIFTKNEKHKVCLTIGAEAT